MKLLKSTLFSVLAAAVALAGCQREAIDPDAQTPGQGEEIVIPVSVEGAIPCDGTKVTVDPANGATAWQENDQVAVWLYNTGTSSGSYVFAKVKDSAIHLNMTTAQQRQGYAVYPAGQQAGDGSTAQVVYPTSYNMSGKDLTSANTWAPTPMVALNTQGSDLNFFHVGGLLRLHVTDIPSGTTGLSVTFVSDDPTDHPIYVTGTFDVSNPGTLSATTVYNSGGGNVISFTNLTIANSEVYLNIPLPTIDFSHLSAIQVSNTNGTVYTAEARLTGWGSLGHAQGKKLPMSFFSIDFLPGYDGSFNGGLLNLSPGILKWDATLNSGAGAYTLTSGEDPLELLRYYGNNSSMNVYYHQWETMRNNINGVSGGNINNTITVDGVTWRVPSKTEWESLVSTSSYTSRLNSLAPNSRRFGCIVNLSEATNVAEIDYSGYISCVGMVILPEYLSVSCPAYSSLSWPTVKKLIDAGCIFSVESGYGYGTSTWGNNGHEGLYYCSTYYDAFRFDGTFSLSFIHSLNGNDHFPVRLVR